MTSSLRNVPDGFLVKLKRTGKSKNIKSATKEFGLDFGDISYSFRFSRGKMSLAQGNLSRWFSPGNFSK